MLYKDSLDDDRVWGMHHVDLSLPRVHIDPHPDVSFGAAREEPPKIRPEIDISPIVKELAGIAQVLREWQRVVNAGLLIGQNVEKELVFLRKAVERQAANPAAAPIVNVEVPAFPDIPQPPAPIFEVSVPPPPAMVLNDGISFWVLAAFIGNAAAVCILSYAVWYLVK